MDINDLIIELKPIKTILKNHAAITGLGYDSRKITDGNCFLAIDGYSLDGHKFIDSAIENGAKSVILTKEDYIKDNDINYILVKDSRRALALISKAYYDDPSKDITLIGVTGTNGKTTTAQTIETMLSSLGRNTAVFGTIGNKINGVTYDTNNTTPEASELNRLFAQMKEYDVDTCVMEVSSHALSLDRVYGLNFDIGIFTNLTPDHLDFHSDMDDYFNAKEKLFYMTNIGNIINTDDKYGEKLCGILSSKGYDFLTVGLDKSADISATHIQMTENGTRFTLVTPEFKTDVSVALQGKVFIYNYLCAVGAMILLGYNESEIVSASKEINYVPGRLELVKNDKGLKVYVDYAHTPDALDKVIDIVREMTSGKVAVLFGCGGNRDKTKRPIMGEIATRKADIAVLTSDNPRTEDPQTIIDEVLEGIPTHNREKLIVEIDRATAIEKAIKSIGREDVLVIAGKGHETYQIIGTEKFDFDDREIAREVMSRI